MLVKCSHKGGCVLPRLRSESGGPLGPFPLKFGENEVSDAYLKAAEGHRAIQKWFDSKMLIKLSGGVDVPKPKPEPIPAPAPIPEEAESFAEPESEEVSNLDCLDGMSAPDAREAVSTCSDTDLLELWKAHESRKTVIKSIEKRLEELWG